MGDNRLEYVSVIIREEKMAGRVAVVTGGTRGIGGAISRMLKDKGYKVAATYAGNDEAASKFKGETGINVYKFDVGDFAACQSVIADIEKDLGPVDVLVNNAGITRDSTMRRLTRDMWDAVIDTNLGSCFNMSKAEEIGRGVMFLIADDAGFITGSTLSINGGQHMY